MNYSTIPPAKKKEGFLFLFRIIVFKIIVPLFFSAAVSSIPGTRLYSLIPFMEISFIFLLYIVSSSL